MRDPDLALWFRAAAGAMVQLGIVVAALAAWRLAETGVAALGRCWAFSGGRGRFDTLAGAAGSAAAVVATLPVLLGLAGLAVWSVAGFWAFPDVLPAQFTLRTWTAAAPGLLEAMRVSVIIALAATAFALALVLAWLDFGDRSGRAAAAPVLWLLYLPLIVPQVAFLFGLQILGLSLGLDGTLAGVILAHVVFVLPYVFLSLADPWRALDRRFAEVAASLGARPAGLFWRLRLPMMLAPVLTAAAVGFAVSIGLYLPTLLIGGGRVATLTTEAVALAAGGDRRLIGVWGLAQSVAPFAGFAVALAVPSLVWRRRRGLRVPA
jgi:putative thiamine transport system permease protein